MASNAGPPSRDAGAPSQKRGWQRGFPPKSGMYLVELEDGELCVTPWSDGRDWCEADQEYRAGGWRCLTDSCATVQRWCHVADVKALLGGNPIETDEAKTDG